MSMPGFDVRSSRDFFVLNIRANFRCLLTFIPFRKQAFYDNIRYETLILFKNPVRNNSKGFYIVANVTEIILLGLMSACF